MKQYWIKKIISISSVTVGLLFLILSVAPLHAAAESEFKQIDIDEYVKKSVIYKKGATSIIRPVPVQFTASVKQYPRKRKIKYLYEILQIFPMEPRPEVSHRMFVTTPANHIMPVYVDDSMVKLIKKHLKEEGEQVTFKGFHMYTYSKGPAIMVTAFEKLQ